VPIFLPAVILGAVFVVLGVVILASRAKAAQMVTRRYQATGGKAPGPGFAKFLGMAITALGIIAIAAGLMTKWPI
jgi:dipeptide/tripeptide permease